MSTTTPTLLQRLEGGLISLFRTLSTAMGTSVSGTNLPMIGSATRAVNRDVFPFKSLANDLLNLNGAHSSSDIQRILNADLKKEGFGTNQAIVTGSAATGYAVTINGAKRESVTDTLSSNLGLDSKIFRISGTHTVSASDTLGLNLAFSVDSLGFHMDTLSSVDIKFRDRLPATLNGKVGFFNGTLREDSLTAANDGLNADIKFRLGSNASITAVTTSGSFVMHSNLSTNAGSRYLPSLRSGLSVDWQFGQDPLIKLLDANADLGALFAPNGIVKGFATGIQRITTPLAPIAKVLTDNLPLIDQLGIKESPIDILQSAGALDANSASSLKKACIAIKSADSLATKLNELTEGSISLGSYSVGGFTYTQLPGARVTSPVSSPTLSLVGPQPTLPALIGDIQTQIETWASSSLGTVHLDLLTNPAAITGLLVSQNTDLLKWELPTLGVQANLNIPSIATPIPGLYINVGGGASVDVNVGVGYDTKGITEYQASATPSASLLLDGLYVYEPGNNTPLFGASINLTAGVELNALVASAAVTGNLRASFSSSLSVDKGYLFNQGTFNPSLPLSNTISLSAGLNASLTVGWPPFGWTDEYTLIPEQTLWSKNWGPSDPIPSTTSGALLVRGASTTFADFYAPLYANNGSSTLRYGYLDTSDNLLRMGRGSNQVNGNGYTPEKAWISQGANGTVNISMDSLGSQRYTLTGSNQQIYATVSSSVDNSIIADQNVTLGLNFRQPNGYTGNKFRDVLFGGAGNDTLYTYNDRNVLYGGGGYNRIDATGNFNLIYTGTGHDTISGGPASGNIINFTPATTPLKLYLGRADSLQGCASLDVITGKVNEWIGTTLGDTMTGSGRVILDGGRGNDIINGGATSGTANSDQDAELLVGGRGSDYIVAGVWARDTLIGVDEFESPASLRGNSGIDTLVGDPLTAPYYGLGADLFVLGDAAGSFYTGTLGGYAEIQNFAPGADRLQLTGQRSDYHIYSYTDGGHGISPWAIQTDFDNGNGKSTYIIAYIEGISSLNDANNILNNALYIPKTV
jgi:Ca2+-binding RTX toxin-like protein